MFAPTPGLVPAKQQQQQQQQQTQEQAQQPPPPQQQQPHGGKERAGGSAADKGPVLAGRYTVRGSKVHCALIYPNSTRCGRPLGRLGVRAWAAGVRDGVRHGLRMVAWRWRLLRAHGCRVHTALGWGRDGAGLQQSSRVVNKRSGHNSSAFA